MNIQIAKPESVGMNSQALNRLSAAMGQYVERGQIAGLVTLISRRGKIVHLQAQGMSYAEENQPMKPDTIFRMASMTKPVTCAALMMLFEEGGFSLDDPLENWLPEYANMTVQVELKTESASGSITVRHLLTHTVGLSEAFLGITAEGFSSKPDRPGTVEEALIKKANLPMEFHPGQRWIYRNATAFVGVLVEKISNMTLNDFFKQRIFIPLEMDDTFFNPPESKISRMAATYRSTDTGAIQLSMPPEYMEPSSYFSGAGGLFSTAADWWRFHQMILDKGEYEGAQILKPETVNMMTSNQIGDMYVDFKGPGYGFGFGWSVVTDPDKAKEKLPLNSFGWPGAFNTNCFVCPDQETIGILLSQLAPFQHLDIQNEFSSLVVEAFL